MTTKHVTVTTKLIRPLVHVRQHMSRCIVQQENSSSPKVYFAPEFQVVAVVLMLKVSRKSKKGQMKLQIDPSITYRINASSFAAASEITFALSVATCG